VDALTGLLEGPRANGAFLLRSVLRPPWSLLIRDEAPLTLVAVIQGEAWLIPDGREPIPLRPGGVAIVRGPEHYVVADRPTTAPSIVIEPGQISTTMDGEYLCDVMDLGIRSWGNASTTHDDGSTMLLTGTYQTPSEISRLLLGALPGVIALSADSWHCPFLDLLSAEIIKDEPGQELVLDRLLDLVLIAALRAWLAGPEAQAPAWYRARGDAVVGAAIGLLQEHPARPWTVASLAAAVGVSRAVLARRFTDLVGAAPMTYLAQWRLALAADLLREPSTTISKVAREVGYSTPFALSAAFKRVRGVTPREYRQAAAGQ
jgi:AraC-like DNA-binding protein